MRLITLATAVGFALTSTVAFAQTAPSAAGAAKAAPTAAAASAGAHYTAESTNIGTLLDDPAAKAVLVKYIPDIANNPGLAQASTMTLKDIQQYAADQLTDKVMSDIDTDLAKIPVAKK